LTISAGERFSMFGTASSSWNCTPAKPSCLYIPSLRAKVKVGRTVGLKGSAPS
jgi:hypothetical protein